ARLASKNWMIALFRTALACASSTTYRSDRHNPHTESTFALGSLAAPPGEQDDRPRAENHSCRLRHWIEANIIVNPLALGSGDDLPSIIDGHCTEQLPRRVLRDQ